MILKGQQKYRKVGAVFLIFALMLTLLWPVQFAIEADSSNLPMVKQVLKDALVAATKSAATEINEVALHEGKFMIDRNKALETFKVIIGNNLKVDSSTWMPKEGSPLSSPLHVRVYLYNDWKEAKFPNGVLPLMEEGDTKIPLQDLTITVKKPTILAIASFTYTSFWGKKEVITEYASAQVNGIDEILNEESSSPQKVVFKDTRYRNSWTGSTDTLVDYLSARNFTPMNADDLGNWMKEKVLSNSAQGTIVVMAQDIVPDTIAGQNSSTALIRKYLDAGGKVIWIGDIPMYYQGRSDGSIVNWGVSGAQGILGVTHIFDNEGTPVTFTQDGLDYGLTKQYESVRPLQGTPAVTLAKGKDGLASAYILRFQNGGEFIRLVDRPSGTMISVSRDVATHEKYPDPTIYYSDENVAGNIPLASVTDNPTVEHNYTGVYRGTVTKTVTETKSVTDTLSTGPNYPPSTKNYSDAEGFTGTLNLTSVDQKITTETHYLGHYAGTVWPSGSQKYIPDYPVSSNSFPPSTYLYSDTSYTGVLRLDYVEGGSGGVYASAQPEETQKIKSVVIAGAPIIPTPKYIGHYSGWVHLKTATPKTISDYVVDTGNIYPSSTYNYNVGGYSGEISLNYVETKQIPFYSYIGHYAGEVSRITTVTMDVEKRIPIGATPPPSSVPYNENGYVGTLTLAETLDNPIVHHDYIGHYEGELPSKQSLFSDPEMMEDIYQVALKSVSGLPSRKTSIFVTRDIHTGGLYPPSSTDVTTPDGYSGTIPLQNVTDVTSIEHHYTGHYSGTVSKVITEYKNVTDTWFTDQTYPPVTKSYSDTEGFSGTLSRTNVTNSPTSHHNYTGTYSGTVRKPVVAIDSKYYSDWVDDTGESYPPSSIYISDDGYGRSGTLYRYDVSTYPISHPVSRTFTKYGSSNTVTKIVRIYYAGPNAGTKTTLYYSESNPAPSTYYVNEDGFSGNINRSGTQENSYTEYSVGGDGKTWYDWKMVGNYTPIYSGTLTKTVYSTGYKGHYNGTLGKTILSYDTKPVTTSVNTGETYPPTRYDYSDQDGYSGTLNRTNVSDSPYQLNHYTGYYSGTVSRQVTVTKSVSIDQYTGQTHAPSTYNYSDADGYRGVLTLQSETDNPVTLHDYTGHYAGDISYDMSEVLIDRVSLVDMVHSPETIRLPTVLPNRYKNEVSIMPIPVKAGYNVTIYIMNRGTGSVEMRLSSNGLPVKIGYGTETLNVLRFTIPDGGTYLTFYIPEEVRKGAIIEMELTGFGKSGTSSAYLIRPLFKVVGSAYQDVLINRTN